MEQINCSWLVLYNKNSLKREVVNNIIRKAGFVYGSHPREYKRIFMNYDRISESFINNIHERFYDKDVFPETLQWRNFYGIRYSDIDCIMTQQIYDEFKNSIKKYYISSEEEVYNSAEPDPYLRKEGISKHLKIVICSLNTSIKADVLIVDCIETYLEKIKLYDFDVNGLIMYHSDESKIIIRHVNKDVDIKDVYNNILNNTACYNPECYYEHPSYGRVITRRICKMFYNGYNILHITFLKDKEISIKLVSNLKCSTLKCVVCNDDLKDIIVANVLHHYFHTKCYASFCLELNKKALDLQITDNGTIRGNPINVPYDNRSYTFTGPDALDHFLTMYNLFINLTL